MPLGKLRPFFDIAGDNFLDKYKENDPGIFHRQSERASGTYR